MLRIILLSFISGFTIIIGGFLGLFLEKRKPPEELLHATVAFGGGILLSAVSFVLAPRAAEGLNIPLLFLSFVGGSLIFFLIDRSIEKKGSRAGQLMAMLMDFVPEAIAMGAVFAHDPRLGFLLALFIGLQNLPESFNSYMDLRASKMKPWHIIRVFIPLSLLGIGGALAGFYLLTGQPMLIAILMSFSSGGIVYLMFQDIAPLSKMENRWIPPLGASIGFMVGMIGEKLLG